MAKKAKRLPLPTDTRSFRRWLRSWDVILINSSAGKDSQAMLTHLVWLARLAGCLDRLLVVHADLGRVEWEGTRQLAEAQARHYGVPFVAVARDRDLLSQIEHEQQDWPDSKARFCTSDHKTSQVTKLITKLVNERWDGSQPVRILNCLGIRGQESPKRRKKPPLSVDAASNGKRIVHRWLPIHQWVEEQVWQVILTSKVPYHWAYDVGMSRLSCCFCVMASKRDLTIAARYNPQLAEEYARVEQVVGRPFRKGDSITNYMEQAVSLAA